MLLGQVYLHYHIKIIMPRRNYKGPTLVEVPKETLCSGWDFHSFYYIHCQKCKDQSSVLSFILSASSDVDHCLPFQRLQSHIFQTF